MIHSISLTIRYHQTHLRIVPPKAIATPAGDTYESVKHMTEPPDAEAATVIPYRLHVRPRTKRSLIRSSLSSPVDPWEALEGSLDTPEGLQSPAPEHTPGAWSPTEGVLPPTESAWAATDGDWSPTDGEWPPTDGAAAPTQSARAPADRSCEPTDDPCALH